MKFITPIILLLASSLAVGCADLSSPLRQRTLLRHAGIKMDAKGQDYRSHKMQDNTTDIFCYTVIRNGDTDEYNFGFIKLLQDCTYFADPMNNCLKIDEYEYMNMRNDFDELTCTSMPYMIYIQSEIVRVKNIKKAIAKVKREVPEYTKWLIAETTSCLVYLLPEEMEAPSSLSMKIDELGNVIAGSPEFKSGTVHDAQLSYLIDCETKEKISRIKDIMASGKFPDSTSFFCDEIRRLERKRKTNYAEYKLFKNLNQKKVESYKFIQEPEYKKKWQVLLSPLRYWKK